MLTLNKPNTNRKSKSVPFSLNASQRGLGFHLCLDFLCSPTASTFSCQKGGYCIYINQIFPSFSCGMSRNVTHLDQLHESENI